MSVEEKISALDDIIAKLRYVKYGDIWESRNHNDPVDAIKAIRELCVALYDRIKSLETGAGAHASTHYADGSDPLLGWLAPSHIAPKSDEPASLYFRTKNISGTRGVMHSFVPTDDTFGRLGGLWQRFGEGFILWSNWWEGRTHCAYDTYFPYDEYVNYALRPKSDGYSYVGVLDHRFAEVHAITIYQGDLGFEEDRCMVCGKPFKENDSIVLKVRKIDKKNKQILTVPVHAECNPHEISDKMLEYHEKNVLSPRKDPKDELLYKMPNPEIGFEIVLELPINDELMFVQANFEDGIKVSPIVKIDASEEEVINAIKEAYLRRKKEIISEYELKQKGKEKLMKLGKSWKGYKGKIKI